MVFNGLFSRISGWREPAPVVGDGEVLQHPARIAKFLQQATVGHILVNVTWQQVSDSFSSAILKVAPEHGYLLLDELNPDRGHGQLSAGVLLQVDGRLDGVQFRFSAPVSEIGGESGIAFYKLPIPKQIHRAQQRVDFRVQLGVSRNISVYFSEPDGRLLHGELADLSCSGLRARVQAAAEPSLARGTLINSCTIQLPNTRPIATQAEIRHIETRAGQLSLSVGARFIHLDRADERLVEKFMKTVEREQLRRRPDTRAAS